MALIDSYRSDVDDHPRFVLNIQPDSEKKTLNMNYRNDVRFLLTQAEKMKRTLEPQDFY